MNVIKLGGSIITEKENYREVNMTLLRKLCKILSVDKERKILIHGAGSFGHIMALKHGLDRPGRIAEKGGAISKVMSDVLSLDTMIIEELNKNGVRAISVPPHAIYHGNTPDFRIVSGLLRMGFVPVLFGDIVVTVDKYRIISGDEIALDLSREFEPESVVFLTDVDGLYDSDPKVNRRARFIESIRSRDISVIDTGTDATGSMAGKMERIKKMVRYTKRVVILNGCRPERVRDFFLGKEVRSTVIT